MCVLCAWTRTRTRVAEDTQTILDGGGGEANDNHKPNCNGLEELWATVLASTPRYVGARTQLDRDTTHMTAEERMQNDLGLMPSPSSDEGSSASGDDDDGLKTSRAINLL
jgi:hypothetical protein